MEMSAFAQMPQATGAASLCALRSKVPMLCHDGQSTHAEVPHREVSDKRSQGV
jgi:hypothetical protein